MTILAEVGGLMVCGSVRVIHRVRGRRLPHALFGLVGVKYEYCSDGVLAMYRDWLLRGPDGPYGHIFELDAIDDALSERQKATP